MALGLLAFAACGGPSKVAKIESDAARPELVGVELGRLVDVFAYRRIDPADGDRRNRFNRQLVRVAANVVINSGIEAQPLFDPAGEEVRDANYEFLAFDRTVGHEELVILWDDREGPEAAQFAAALEAAQEGLIELAAAYRGQDTRSRPIPVVPRNAALRLRFSSELTVDENFFRVNPSAIQLLEFKGDPNVVAPVDAFRALGFRAIPSGRFVVLDPTVLGGESVTAGFSSPGLPLSPDNVTANIRLAVPTRGGAAAAFFVKADPIPTLNGVDSTGRPSVIRDFRSGNLSDGTAGRMTEPEAPMILGSVGVGITAVDTNQRVITLNKRLHQVPVRGRYPFVEGALRPDRTPLGPDGVPIRAPLSSGDHLVQLVRVAMPDGTIESVTVRAEILENLEIGTVVGDPQKPVLGFTSSQTSQGEELPVVRVRVASLDGGRDSLGRPVAFTDRPNLDASGRPIDPGPNGGDCVLRVRYVQNVPFTNVAASVSDVTRQYEFLRVDPRPAITGSQPASPNEPAFSFFREVSPGASFSLEFTKPMDLEQVDNTLNFLLTSGVVTGAPESGITAANFAAKIGQPKELTAAIVPTRLSDNAGDGSLLGLKPPMDLFHASGQAEEYWMHVRLGSGGVVDLGGKPLDVFQRDGAPIASWSVRLNMNAAAPSNLVGWHAYVYEAPDEDGTLPGSVDIFGQFRLQNGRLLGAPGVRFSRTADSQNLGQVDRHLRGESWNQQAGWLTNPTNPPGQALATDPEGNIVPANHPGTLYWQPKMFDTVNPAPVGFPPNEPQNVGRVIEPHSPNGSRMQMRYLEDDFSLSYTQPSEFCIDVEQIYWSPFNDETVFFDVFDRYSMSLSHANKRPDLLFVLNAPPGMPPPPLECLLDCRSMNSSLSLTFSENVLAGTADVPVFQDQVYTINPNNSFRSQGGVRYVPYPRFDRTYTWRDSRLVTIDASGTVLGLGGAQNPRAPAPTDDVTARVSSPWVTDNPPQQGTAAGQIPFRFSRPDWVLDDADFNGTVRHDHDPIALPLLVDFKVFPSSASGINSSQVAMIGPPSAFPANPGGYYNQTGFNCNPQRPTLTPLVRVHATGGRDLITNAALLIDPASQVVAQTSNLKDAGLGAPATGLFTAPPGDGMLHWAQADFVRKVSTMTFGFIDTLQPQRHFASYDPVAQSATPREGFPNLAGVPNGANLRIADLIVQMDPPPSRQPAGTSVVVEIRGATTFERSDLLYNPASPLTTPAVPASDRELLTTTPATPNRGNLLNPNYACEAYRYSQTTAGTAGDRARVVASGLTPYVTDDQLASIRSPAGLLPRYLNMRLVMTNNVDISPSVSPSLRSMFVVYRMASQP